MRRRGKPKLGKKRGRDLWELSFPTYEKKGSVEL